MIVGMVSTRFTGLDGVSLESLKLAEVIRDAGGHVVWFAGELGRDFEPGTVHAPADLSFPENRALQERSFGVAEAPAAHLEEINKSARSLRSRLEVFVEEFSVGVLVPQNALAIPMQLPLGVAITDLLRDSGLTAVAHHHDLWWERGRFSLNAVGSILDYAFPPSIAGLSHVVIHSGARDELLRRRGIAATILPNVMDFEREPHVGDAGRFRRHIGVGDSDLLLVQPTRIIPRKGIETTLELAAQLGDDAIRVVVTHAADRDHGYARTLVEVAADLGVDLRLLSVGGPGEPSLADAYAAADLVTYPSWVEGFGNALVEALYYRRPILVRRYPVYVSDIAPTGVRCIEISEQLTPQVVAAAAEWLGDPASWREAVEANHEVGLRHFSFAVVRERFLPLLEPAAG